MYIYMFKYMYRICNAGRRIIFARGKSLNSTELFLGILVSEFRFTVFISWCAVEWIHKSPTAIVTQPIFVTNIRTALFEKRNVKGEVSEVEV